MKRRKFLKFLALIPALPIACQGWPFKPKSKPPPTIPYTPDDPEMKGFEGILSSSAPEWNSGPQPTAIVLSPEMFKAWVDITGKV